MKTHLLRCLLLIWLANPVVPVSAALYSSWSGTQTILDNYGSGLSYHFNLSDSATVITDVSVTFDISGGYNGDLYAYLSHGDGFAVLLNRAGRTSTSEYGYSTTGFAITLTGSATADIHHYQSLGATYNGTGQLLGTWGADGRDVVPALAYDTTARTATLADFTGKDPNGGDWILYFRDASPGGISTLNSWSVQVTAVPEPVNVALGVLGGVFLVAIGLRTRRVRERLRRGRAAAVRWVAAV